jgi:signal transduction histidine kinase
MSIKVRLMLIFAGLMAVILAVFSVYVYYSTVFIRKTAFYDRLWERTEISYQLLHEGPRPDLSKIHPSVRNTYWTILPEEEIIVFDDAGHYTYINEFVEVKIDYQGVRETISKEGKIETRIGTRQVVGLVRKIEGADYTVIVSAFDRNGQKLLYRLRLTLITSFLASVMVIILTGWYFSGQTLKPVERIIETAEKISGSDLHLRVPIPKGKNELVRLVNTINESLDRLQKAFEVQKTFVANASHELRTPLTALHGDLEVALLKERSAEEYRSYLKIAYDDARRLTQLVNHLLLFAQTAEERRAFKFVAVRIDELVMDAMQKLKLSHPGRFIDFRFAGNVPDESHLMIPGNEHLLLVAFTNIIDNALKYSETEDVQIIVSTHDALQIQVIDQGIGISLQDQEKIFEPFYRSKRSSDVIGFGIGLPLVRQIIELHQGTIAIESKINEGTVITISFSTFV